MDDRKPFKPILLTALDHTIAQVNFSQFLCFRSSDPQGCLSCLERGIDNLVSCIPFLTGEITPCGDLGLKCGLLQVQPSDIPIKDIAMLSTKRYPGQFLPPNQCLKSSSPETAIREIPSLDGSYYPLPTFIPDSELKPVLRFQANIMSDGILLGISFSHSVFDGTGAGKIIEMFAECCRSSSLQSINLPTNCATESKLRKAFSQLAFTHQSQHDHASDYGPIDPPTDSANEKPEITRSLIPALKTCPFVFSSEKITFLRDMCNDIIPLVARMHKVSQDDSVEIGKTSWSRFVSSNDVLTSLIGLCIERARNKAGSISTECTGLAMSVDLRERLQPPLPEFYLGNAVKVIRTHTRLSCDDAASGVQSISCPALGKEQVFQLASIAFRIRSALESTDDSHIRSLISYLHKQPDWSEICLKAAGTVVSSWRHLNVYNLDFGPKIGKIDNFEIEHGLFDGMSVILPAVRIGDTHHKRGPWDVRITLNPDNMDSIMMDTLFNWALSPHKPDLH